MSTTLKISDVLDYVAPFVNYLPLSVGSKIQPAIGIANAVVQTILGPPFKWRWNRNTVNFTTTAGVQDYLNAGSWASNTAYAAGTTIIDSDGNGQLVITAGTSTTGSHPTWQTGLFALTTDNTVIWQNIGKIANISTISDLGFIESATLQDINATPAKWQELEVKLNLEHDTSSTRPRFISAQNDSGDNIKFRFMPVPGAAYPCSVTYQKKVPVFTSLNSTLGIPDEMFYVYSNGFLALSYLLSNDNRYGAANSKFVGHLIGASEGLTETQINIFLNNWNNISQTALTWNMQSQNGNQGRII